MSFNFGAPKTASGFTLPVNTAPSTSTSGFQFGSGDNKTQQAKPNLFGSPANQSGFSLTSTTSTPSLGFNVPVASTTTTPQFNLGAAIVKPAAPASVSFLPASTSAATTAVAFNLPSAPKTTAAVVGALPFKTAPSSAASTAAATLGFSLSSTTVTTTTAASTDSLVPTSTTVTTESAIPTLGSLTFAQLEDAINKWTIDLEEQGKLFGNQAKQLNAWDRLLISNGEKIMTLNNGIERVKQQQQQLDQELDFVLAQQKELEDLIVPLEKELNDIPVMDMDRNHTYQMAENLDSQLKQMSEDLKEVIEHLNEANKNQELSNPITQIGRILNAHMNSLQWIDRNTTKISTHLDHIAKMHDMNRRNHEMNLQRTYD